jgi:hypothetical protein
LHEIKTRPYAAVSVTHSHNAFANQLGKTYTGNDSEVSRLPVFRREGGNEMIRKLKSGKYRLYSRKADPKTHKRRNLGTFDSREAAEKHERDVQYFKRH